MYRATLGPAHATVDARLERLADARDAQVERARAAYRQAVQRSADRFARESEAPVRAWEDAQRRANRDALRAFDQRIEAAERVGDLTAVETLQDRKAAFIESSLAERNAFLDRIAFARATASSDPALSLDADPAAATQPDAGESESTPSHDVAPVERSARVVVVVRDDDKTTKPHVAVNGAVIETGIEQVSGYVSRFTLDLTPGDLVTLRVTDRKGGAMAFLVLDETMQRVLNHSRVGMAVHADREALTAAAPSDVPGWEPAVAVPRLNHRSILPRFEGVREAVGDAYAGVWVGSSGTGSCTAIVWPPAR